MNATTTPAKQDAPPKPDAKPLSLERMVRRFRENRDREYLKYIDALKQKECLGWEAKIKAGVFGGMELNAHCKSNEHLGRHLAWNMALEELLRDVCHECGGTGGVDSGGVTPWGSAITLPCPSCSPNDKLSHTAPTTT